MEYYHLRIDCPHPDFALDKLNADYSFYWVQEISDKGKHHLHVIILLEHKMVQKLRLFFGVTYKNYLKKDDYWEKTYNNSQKIQIYSLKKVRKLQKLWTYIHKDKGHTGEWNWSQDKFDLAMKNEKTEEEEKEEKMLKEINDFWIGYKETAETYTSSSYNDISPSQPTYHLYYFKDALQNFYNSFGDLKGFRVKFLTSAYKNNIIDFDMYMAKMYRL